MKVGYSFEGLVKRLIEIDESAVHKSGDETITGLKTFTACPATTGAQGTSNNHLIKKSFFDTELVKKLNVVGGDLSGRLRIVTAAGTVGLPNNTNSNANNYNNKASLATVCGNNALHVFGNDVDNSRTFALQSGSSNPALATIVGDLLLNPYGGSVVLGHSVATKGALAVLNGASIRWNTSLGTHFHMYCDNSALRWGSGNTGDTPMMALTGNGDLSLTSNATIGGYVSSRGYASVTNFANTSSLAMEAPASSDPYISSKTIGEVAPSAIITFGKVETSFLKKVSVSHARISADGGLQFSPYVDMSGITWGMGINVAARTLGVYAYNDGVYSGVAMEFDTSLNARFYKGVIVTGNVESSGGVFGTYMQVKNAGNPSFELHEPGKYAVMMYKPQGTSTVRFCSSNGAGGEAQGYGGIDADGFFTVNGRHRAYYPAANRSWGQIGKNAFHLEGLTVGAGTFVGTLGAYLQYPGQWGAEFGYGVFTNPDPNLCAHVLNCTDGGTYHRFWQFRNDGELISSSGGGIHAGGIPFGTSFGGYGDMVTWANASFSLQSHTHDARTGNYSMVQGRHSEVGTYMFAACHPNVGGPVNPGGQVPGSLLYPAACSEWSQNRGYTLPGTWMCCGYVDPNTDDRWDDRTTLWFRVA